MTMKEKKNGKGQPPAFSKPTAVGGMTPEQLDAELQKGLDSMKNERLYSEEEIDAMFAEEFGI